MKIDGVYEVLDVTEATGSVLYALYPGVYAFRFGIVSLEAHRVHYAVEMALDGLRQFLHRLQAASVHPSQQLFPGLFRPRGRYEIPQPSGEFLDAPRPGCLESLSREFAEPLAAAAVYVLRVVKPGVFGALQRVVAFPGQLGVLLFSHIVDSVAEEAHHVELVETDQSVGEIQVSTCSFDEGHPQIHGDAAELAQVGFPLRVELLDGGRVAVDAHIQDAVGILVMDYRNVAVADLVGLLVETDVEHLALGAPCHASPDSPADNPVRLVVRDASQFGYRAYAHDLPVHVYYKSFHEDGEARVRFGPWHLHLVYSVPVALDPRYFGHDDGLVLESRQMAPFPDFLVVPEAPRAAFWTDKAILGEAYVYAHLAVFLVEFNIVNRPRGGYSQQLSKKLYVLHASNLAFGVGLEN